MSRDRANDRQLGDAVRDIAADTMTPPLGNIRLDLEVEITLLREEIRKSAQAQLVLEQRMAVMEARVDALLDARAVGE